MYVGESELQKEVRLASRRDAFAKEVKQGIQNGAKSHFHLRNGLLWYKQNRLYVLEGKIRNTLLKECHDGPLASHGGTKRTTTFLKKFYYWPNLKDCCRNPNLAKCGGEAQHLEKLGTWSPPGLPNVQSSTAGPKTLAV